MGQRSWSSSSPSSDQQHDTQSQEAARSSIDNPFSASDTSIPNARQNESSTLTRNELHPPSKPSPTYNSSGSTYASQPVSTLTPHQRFLDRIDDFDPVFSQGPSVSKPGEKSAFQPQKKLEISKGHGNPTISGSANREAVQSSPPSSTKTRTSPSSRCSHQDASRRPSSLAQAHRQHPHSPYGRPGYNRTVGIEEGDEEDKESSVWVLVYLSLMCPPLSLLIVLYTTFLLPLLLLSHPFYLFPKRHPHLPLALRIYNSFAPALRFQLRRCRLSSLPAPPPPPPSPPRRPIENTLSGEKATASDSYKSVPDPSYPYMSLAIRTLAIIVASPAYSIFISLAACVAGAFWIFAEILGDPVRSKKGGDEDGRRAVEWVKQKWCEWLEKGLKV